MDIMKVYEALSSLRAPLATGEYDLHGLVAATLNNAQIDYIHEAALGPRCRIDFLCGPIGIEVKRGRPSPSVLRPQIYKYTQSSRLTGLILVVERTANLPATMNGKAIKILSLNRLWGIAL